MPIKRNSHPDHAEHSAEATDLSHRQNHTALRWLIGLAAGFFVFKSFRRKTQSLSPLSFEPLPPATHSQGPAGFLSGHEQRDAQVGWIFGIVLFLLVSGLAIQLVLGGVLNALKRTPPPVDYWRPTELPGRAAPSGPPLPRLQVSPPADLQAFRAREEAELSSYGWINKTAGVVRVPIARAMELVLEKGLPLRNGTNGNRLGPSTYELIQQRPLHREPEIQGKNEN